MVQAAGDCHCLNFGGFATPERRLAFDINDFDETAVAPWEWDLKRLATSFVVATLDVLAKEARTELAEIVARSYRATMAEVAAMPVLAAWYQALEHRRRGHSRSDRNRRAGRPQGEHPRGRIPSRSPRSAIAPAPRRASTTIPSTASITRRPPMPPPSAPPSRRDWWTTPNRSRPSAARSCSAIAWPTRPTRWLGVGAVGTLCGVLLMVSGDGESLYLQFKEANRSVLEAHAGPSPFAHHGERVVRGQRLLQAASDMLLGFATGPTGRHLYIRQLRDAKIKPQLEIMSPRNFRRYAATCGEVLARAHARTADAVVMSAYLGKSAAFDEAIGAFANVYAKQTERDHEALLKAIKSGLLPSRDEDL